MVPIRPTLVLCLCGLFACNSAVTRDAGQEVEAGISMDMGRLTLEPQVVDFGDRCGGVSTEASVTLRNTGTADVYVAEVSWSEDASPDFEVLDADSLMGWLSPGASRTMTLRYTPAGDDSDSGELEVRVVQGFVGERVSVLGREGGPSLQTSPLSLDLGAVAVGTNQSAQLTVRSAGTTPLTLYSAELETEVEGLILDATALSQGPKTLASGDTLRLTATLSPVSYQPEPEAPIGTLRLGSSDCAEAEVTVSVYGWPGGIDRPCIGVVEESFEGRDAVATDVLFIVDNSDSMLGEQDALVAGFASFIGLADELELDYRIGVITTDLEAGGELVGEVIQPSSVSAFADNAKVGVGGPAEEQGLAAAASSLIHSEGFSSHLRPGAFLVLVFVSDEDDQSADSPTSYLDAYRAAVQSDAERLKVHAIVGPPGGCDSAVDGLRYRELVDEAGGIASDICDADFGTALATIGMQSFGHKTNFALGHAANPETVEVTVDEVSCLWGWDLSPDGRVLHFEPDGTCLPEVGQLVRVRYEPICAAP
ncbi:MAG: choice-of-anchor D domain-containing protein [Myxococcota bacterium]